MIRNIIFDYGGVIIDLDYNRTENAFKELGIIDFDKHFNQLTQDSLFDNLDKGIISNEEFRRQLNQQVGTHFSDGEIDTAWNAMLLGIREEKFDVLRDMHKKFRTFLLSNTNRIHLEYISKYLLKTFGLHSINSFFDGVYYSCDMGLRKPQLEIFQRVIAENNLIASETLFIDDSLQHVQGAKKAGLQAVLYPPSEDLEKFLENYLGNELI